MDVILAAYICYFYSYTLRALYMYCEMQSSHYQPNIKPMLSKPHLWRAPISDGYPKLHVM